MMITGKIRTATRAAGDRVDIEIVGGGREIAARLRGADGLKAIQMVGQIVALEVESVDEDGLATRAHDLMPA